MPKFGERKLSTNWLNDEDMNEENQSNKKEATFGSQDSNYVVKIDFVSSLSENKLHTKSEVMIDINNLSALP